MCNLLWEADIKNGSMRGEAITINREKTFMVEVNTAQEFIL